MSSSAKAAITINLDELKALIVEFIVERGGDESELLRRLTLSDFLLWMQEKARTDGKKTKFRTGDHEPVAYFDRRGSANH